MPKKSRRKNKKRNLRTRKKRGGTTERDAYIYRLIEVLEELQRQINVHNTQIQELEQWQDAYENMNLEERIEALERQRSGTGGTGGGKRKKKTRRKRGGGFVDVTPEYIRKNFDQLVGRKVELSEEGVQKKIIIYKLRDETDNIVDYKDIIPIPTFFYYINVDDNQDIQTPRPIGVIDLTEYGPGSIKINVANIQDGSGKRRKKKTRKKRGGWRRIDTDFNKDDIGYYYDCGYSDGVRFREDMTITGWWDVLHGKREWEIREMLDSNRYDPNLILYDESRPNFGEFRIPAQQLCSRGFKPLKRNDAKTGAGRKKKTRKKKKQFLYNPNDPSKSFDVYIDKNPKDTIPIKYTTVKDVKDTIKKLERLYKTKKYPHKRIWQVGMIMKVRLEAMLKHKTKKYPNAKKVKQRFNLANKYFKFLGKRTKKKDFKSRKAMTFKF